MGFRRVVSIAGSVAAVSQAVRLVKRRGSVEVQAHFELYKADVWCEADLLSDLRSAGVTLADCQAVCRANPKCRFLLHGYTPDRQMYRCSTWEACPRSHSYDDGDPNVYKKVEAHNIELHFVSSCNQCNIPWCSNFKVSNPDVETAPNTVVGVNLATLGCDKVNNAMTVYHNSVSQAVYVGIEFRGVKYGDIVFLQVQSMNLRWLTGARGSGNAGVDTRGYEQANPTAYQWQIRSESGDGVIGSADAMAGNCVKYGDIVLLQVQSMNHRWLTGAHGVGNAGVDTQTRGGNPTAYQWQIRSESGDGVIGSADAMAGNCVKYGDIVFLQVQSMNRRWLTGARGSGNAGVDTRDHLDGEYEQANPTAYQWRIGGDIDEVGECIFGVNVFIKSWKGNYYLYDDKGNVGLDDQGNYSKWKIERADRGFVSIKSHRGEYLESRNNAVGVHKDQSTYQTWTIERSGNSGEVLIKNFRGHHLYFSTTRNRNNKASVAPEETLSGGADKWKVTTEDGSLAC